MGKQAEKLAYEQVWIVWLRAVVKMLLRAVARGPGVRDVGGWGAGEGLREWVVVVIGLGECGCRVVEGIERWKVLVYLGDVGIVYI